MNLIGFICALLLCVVKDINGLTKSSKYLKVRANVEQVCAENNRVFTRVGVSSATECAFVCSKENGCDAIFFSVVNGSCTGCMKVTKMSSALVPSTANVYYQLVNANFSVWHYETSAYTLDVSRKMNYTDAKIYCQLLGAHVVVPDSQGEQDFLADRLNMTAGFTRAWIGITKTENTNTFRVEHSGEMVNYTSWYPGQPDVSSGSQTCVSIARDSGWKWRDVSCSFAYCVVCEHD